MRRLIATGRWLLALLGGGRTPVRLRQPAARGLRPEPWTGQARSCANSTPSRSARVQAKIRKLKEKHRAGRTREWLYETLQDERIGCASMRGPTTCWPRIDALGRRPSGEPQCWQARRGLTAASLELQATVRAKGSAYTSFKLDQMIGERRWLTSGRAEPGPSRRAAEPKEARPWREAPSKLRSRPCPSPLFPRRLQTSAWPRRRRARRPGTAPVVGLHRRISACPR